MKTTIAPAPPPRQNGRTSSEPRRAPGFANSVVAAVIGVAFMGSGLITPLYTIYQKAFGFSEVTLTLIYAAYVVGNLAALLFFGRLSDRIGRRAIGIASLLAGCASMILFLSASATGWLFAARVLSGVAVGLASGAGTAWLTDFNTDKALASTMTTAANAFGFALGPLLAGFLAQYASAPLKVTFYAYIPLLLATAFFTLRVPETIKQKGERLTADVLRPRIGVPKELRVAFFPPAATAFGVFALVGFYAALIPTILRESLQLPQPVAGGLIVFELAFVAGIASLLTRRVDNRKLMLWALVLLLPSVAILLSAQSIHSMAALLIATTLAGLCWGFGIRGSLQVINEISPADRRAEIASAYYVTGFIGNSVPVIGVGFISVAANSMVASVTFGCTVAAFALAALIVALRQKDGR